MALTDVQRGDVFIVALDPIIGSEIAKSRPCVIVQRDIANSTSTVTIVCPLTDARRRAAGILNIFVPASEGGLSKNSVVMCNQVRAVDRKRLREHLGHLSPNSMEAIDRGLRAILDL